MGGLLRRLSGSPAQGEGPEAGKVTGQVPASTEDLLRLLQPRLLAEHPRLIDEARRDRIRREQLRSVVLQMVIAENIGHARLTRETLADEITAAMVGYGPLEPLMEDEEITEIMVNGASQVFVERRGQLEAVPVSFRSEEQLMDLISRMVAPLGRRVDVSSPYVDGRLPDGSRINAVIPPLSLVGPVLTVRKFSPRAYTLNDLVSFGTLSQEMAGFLTAALRSKFNLLISGGTGSGKTTTLNALMSSLSPKERIITIEDSAELRIDLPHVVRLECRPANAEGRGEVSMRQLLRNALRMRPDRIVVGECRGAEALDMLQAMNTGHPGSACTLHANSAADAIVRLEHMVLMADATLPLDAIRHHIRSAIDLIVHQARLADGSRKVTQVALLTLTGAPWQTVFRYEPGRGSFVRLPVTLDEGKKESLQQKGFDLSFLGEGAGTCSFQS